MDYLAANQLRVEEKVLGESDGLIFAEVPDRRDDVRIVWGRQGSEPDYGGDYGKVNLVNREKGVAAKRRRIEEYAEELAAGKRTPESASAYTAKAQASIDLAIKNDKYQAWAPGKGNRVFEGETSKADAIEWVKAGLQERYGIGEPTKFSEYVLAGGENYRELLIRLPVPPAAPLDTKGWTAKETTRRPLLGGDHSYTVYDGQGNHRWV